MRLAAVSVTRQGNAVADKLKSVLGIDVYSSYNNKDFNFKDLCKELMDTVDGIIFISSTGIAVRGIAPHLRGKDKDPAVVVVDTMARYAISLAGGHLGGANELALKVAGILGAEPVITTSTDSMKVVAPDMVAKDNNLVIEDLKKAKYIAARLVDGDEVAFVDEDKKLPIPKGYVELKDGVSGLVVVSNKQKLDCYPQLSQDQVLRLIRRNVVLGMGCRKNVDEMKVRKFVVDTLEKYNLAPEAVASVSTVEIKKNEKALNALAEFFNCPLKIHTIDEIKTVEGRYKGSDFVKKTIGVRAVCEPCTELEGSRLITDKISFEGITLCIGVMDQA